MFWWILPVSFSALAWWAAQHFVPPAAASDVLKFGPWVGGLLATVVFGVMSYLLAQLREMRQTAYGHTVRKQQRNRDALRIPLRRSAVAQWSVLLVAIALFAVGMLKSLLPPDYKVQAIGFVAAGFAYTAGIGLLLTYWYISLDNIRAKMNHRDAVRKARQDQIDRFPDSRPKRDGNGPTDPPRFEGHMRSNGA